MATYKNGLVPNSAVPVVVRSGRYPAGAPWDWALWEHRMSAGTAAKHAKLVALAKKRTGKTLAMGDGWSAYRPMQAQIIARQIYGNGAADPGTSSHGGEFHGRDSLALDYSNWNTVYNNDRNAFYADARAAGFVPGVISIANGYPDEPWHVVDYEPWRAVPASEGSEAFDPATGEPIKRKAGSAMLLITAPNRRPLLSDAGYIRGISPANGTRFLSMASRLVEASGGKRLDLTDADYDVSKALLIQGQIPTSEVTLTLTDAQADTLAKAIVENLPAGLSEADVVNAIRSVDFVLRAE